MVNCCVAFSIYNKMTWLKLSMMVSPYKLQQCFRSLLLESSRGPVRYLPGIIVLILLLPAMFSNCNMIL